MDAVQEFEFWSNTKLNMTKTVAMSINGGGADTLLVLLRMAPLAYFRGRLGTL